MEWIHGVSYFFGGAFLANAIPHLISGMMGRPFQSPFAKPPGEGLSSSTVNVLWASFNLAAGYMLVFRVGSFDIRSTSDVLAAGLGAFAIALVLARTFGRFHGGNSPVNLDADLPRLGEAANTDDALKPLNPQEKR